MARSIDQIHNEILQAIKTDDRLGRLNSPSKTAIYRLITYAVAFASRINELLFDQHKIEMDTNIRNQKVGSLLWYRNRTLDFQYGFDLVSDRPFFNNQNATEEQIEESKIVKYAAVSEAEDVQRVIIKIAGEASGVLAPIELEQLNAFIAYTEEFKFAGTPVTVINYEPDRLFLNIQIFRDPLVLDENGVSILEGTKPAEEALKDYLRELPFNGELTINSLVDALQNAQGIKLVNVINIQSSWIDAETNSYGTPEPINVRKIPESGYFQIVNFDQVHYEVV